MVFLHLPTSDAAPVTSSTEVVMRLAALMAGGGTQAVATTTKALVTTREGARPTTPHGFYSGSQTALGETVDVCVEVQPASGATGVMNMSSTGSPFPVAFRCSGLEWTAKEDGGITVAPGDACWEFNVQSRVEGLTLSYSAADDTIQIAGHRRVNALVDLPIECTLRSSKPCMPPPIFTG